MRWCGANAFYASVNCLGLCAVNLSHPAAPAGCPAGGNAPDFCTFFANNSFCKLLDLELAHIPARNGIIVLDLKKQCVILKFGHNM